MSTDVAVVKHKSLVAKFASKYTIEPERLLAILKATAFKQKDGEASNEQMAALLVVADQYGLNPFTREIFAFPDKQNGIVPVVGVDGWSRIINDHPQMDGLEFRMADEWVTLTDSQECPKWMEVVIYRKDRSHPIVVREYLDEVYRPLGVYKDGNKMKPGPWQSHTKRMLRGKTLIQGGRLAFGFSGIYDDDEAARVVEAIDVTPIQTEAPERSAGSRLKAALGVTAGGETLEGTATVVKEVEKHLAETIDTDTGEIMQTNPPADEPHPFDTEKSAAAPEAKATIEQQIEAAPDNPALSKLLPAIMKMKAGPERDRIMQKWNAKVKSFSKPATPSPSAPDPQPSPATEPPAPSEGAAPKPRKPKPKGTPELQAGVMEQMKTAKTVEELDTIADAANEYAWNDEAREALSAEYLKLKDDLEGAGN